MRLVKIKGNENLAKEKAKEPILINGTQYQYENITVVLCGKKIKGLTTIKYK